MLYNVYPEFFERPASCIMGAVQLEDEPDVILECLSNDRNIAARLRMLCLCEISGRPLGQGIIRPLSHEDNLSILELKKSALRMTFFKDSDVIFKGLFVPKAVVFLTCFTKSGQKTPKNEIIRAQKQREKYLTAKADGTLQVKEVTI